MRNCITCKQDKDLTEYGVNKHYSDGIHRSCKQCERDRRKRFYNAHKELESQRFKAYCEKYPERRRATARKHRYGVTQEQFDKFMDKQQGVCAVCSHFPDEGKDLHVDHDHETGRIRGLLCGNCNRALGIMQTDPERIRRLAAYAEEVM